MTDTAKLADVVLPATMFLEHDDIYRGGGNQHIMLGPKLIDPPAGPRSNHAVIEELARRLGVGDLPGFGMTEREHIDYMLDKRGLGSFDDFAAERWADVQPDFRTSHFLNGFAHADGKFRFRPDWTGTAAPNRPPKSIGIQGPVAALPTFPDHVGVIEEADARASVPPRHLAGALVPEFKLHRNADGAGAGGPAGTAHPSRRRRPRRHRHRGPGRDRQRPRRGRAARQTVCRAQAAAC